ncbi:MAG TPA: HAMP domain-containing sensor histidine kinase, partial [Euzebya sp.]|nr:HAMP domain-containing sensor histidine kinase [Euzebya sp.]
RFWRGGAPTAELRELLVRFLGAARAEEAMRDYAARRGQDWQFGAAADADLVDHVERVLGGAVGAASARVAVASVVDEEPIGLAELMDVLEETSQAIAHSRALEEKSHALEAATAELRAANERLTELDRLKDEFVSTVTHELRTPLTSIRSFSEILRDSPDLDDERRQEFLAIVISESERLTRLINAVLDLSKIESGTAEWHISEVDLASLVDDAVASTRQLFAERGAQLRTTVPTDLPQVRADADRVLQVLLNLLSNAVKFCDPEDGTVRLTVQREDGHVRIDVTDNGSGVGEQDRDRIFERFDQGGDTAADTRRGTGLGLPISREIIIRLGGRLWLDSTAEPGARFAFTLPLDDGGQR